MLVCLIQANAIAVPDSQILNAIDKVLEACSTSDVYHGLIAASPFFGSLLAMLSMPFASGDKAVHPGRAAARLPILLHLEGRLPFLACLTLKLGLEI